MLKDLARSGLTKKDAEIMRLKPLSAAQTKSLVKINARSYKIPYFDVRGKTNGFYRVRMLEGERRKLLGKIVEAKIKRYSQPANSEAHVYFPPNQTSPTWLEIAKDTAVPILITEGEKKSYAVTKAGAPCLGLGGVWSFRSRKNEELFIPDLRAIDWRERSVQIVYDSDLVSNEDVQRAQLALASELSREGARVETGFVPEGVDGAKQGVDDYLLSNSLEELFDEASLKPYTLSRDLWMLNDEIAYVEDPGAFYQMRTGILFTRDMIVRTVYPHLTHVVEGKSGLRRESVAEEWMSWPNRRTHSRIAYVPGASSVLDTGELNSWKGWGCEPKKGSTKLWTDFLAHMFQNEMSLLPWFEKWLAYPLQNPGAKLFSSALVYGMTQGTGKSFIGVFMSKIYGDNYSKITNEHLESEFNEWAVNKQFVMAEEISGSDKRRESDKIKEIITRDSLIVNIKYRPTYTIRDCINYYFTSQHPDALYIEPTDRRFMVVEAPEEKLSDADYEELDAWKDGSGPSAIFHRLLHDVDCSDFKHLASAPRSRSKDEMTHLSAGDLDMFCRDLKSDPESHLRFGGVRMKRDLYTAAEIAHLYDPERSKKTTLIAVSKALRRAGVKQLQMTKTDNGMKRLYALRNVDRWLKADHGERAAEYDRDRAIEKSNVVDGRDKFSKRKTKSS